MCFFFAGDLDFSFGGGLFGRGRGGRCTVLLGAYLYKVVGIWVQVRLRLDLCWEGRDRRDRRDRRSMLDEWVVNSEQ